MIGFLVSTEFFYLTKYLLPGRATVNHTHTQIHTHAGTDTHTHTHADTDTHTPYKTNSYPIYNT